MLHLEERLRLTFGTFIFLSVAGLFQSRQGVFRSFQGVFQTFQSHICQDLSPQLLPACWCCHVPRGLLPPLHGKGGQGSELLKFGKKKRIFMQDQHHEPRPFLGEDLPQDATLSLENTIVLCHIVEPCTDIFNVQRKADIIYYFLSGTCGFFIKSF